VKVLGISGSERQAAAALAIDGELVAACTEESLVRVPQIGYRHTGGFPCSAIGACFERAGVHLSDVDRIRTTDPVDGSLAGTEKPIIQVADVNRLRALLAARTFEPVDAVRADAAQLWPAGEARAAVILVVGVRPASAARFRTSDGRLVPLGDLPGADRFLCSIRRVARLLGVDAPNPLDGLERLAAGAAPDLLPVMTSSIRWKPDGDLVFDEEALLRLLPSHGDEQVLRPDAVQIARAMAASVCVHAARLIAEQARELMATAGAQTVGFAGELFTSTALVGRLVKSLDAACAIAPVPELSGRAIGAALDESDVTRPPIRSLALGPEYSEADIKLALENCRLEYLYEPDWNRLLQRVSKMLARGTIVGWFQGPTGFGSHAVGTRSILADAGNAYARENINRFLKRRPVDEPLTACLTAEGARECLEVELGPAFVPIPAKVRSGRRERLRAAIDAQSEVPAQIVTGDQAPLLERLLTAHRERSGGLALLHTTLSGADESAACTPRDAIRTMFSSAMDALVIGRFLLMKDYWQLRSDAEPLGPPTA
jgi:carbamoyltransferase